MVNEDLVKKIFLMFSWVLMCYPVQAMKANRNKHINMKVEKASELCLAANKIPKEFKFLINKMSKDNMITRDKKHKLKKIIAFAVNSSTPKDFISKMACLFPENSELKNLKKEKFLDPYWYKMKKIAYEKNRDMALSKNRIFYGSKTIKLEDNFPVCLKTWRYNNGKVIYCVALELGAFVRGNASAPFSLCVSYSGSSNWERRIKLNVFDKQVPGKQKVISSVGWRKSSRN